MSISDVTIQNNGSKFSIAHAHAKYISSLPVEPMANDRQMEQLFLGVTHAIHNFGPEKSPDNIYCTPNLSLSIQFEEFYSSGIIVNI